MRAIVQRVMESSVKIDGEVVGEIGKGVMILLGIEDLDGREDVEWLVRKIVHMRIFEDEAGKMNCSLLEKGGEALIVSQFTLHASTKKGNRPSFTKAAHPEKSEPLYHDFVREFNEIVKKTSATGRFGADMKVSLINDGPVTIMIDSKLKE